MINPKYNYQKNLHHRLEVILSFKLKENEISIIKENIVKTYICFKKIKEIKEKLDVNIIKEDNNLNKLNSFPKGKLLLRSEIEFYNNIINDINNLDFRTKG